jgi:thermostable 8-oxoguanine DNA glycosylase
MFRCKLQKKDFVFRGLLRCAITGRMISSDIKKGKHVYLITCNPEDITKKIYVNEEKILKQIGAVLESIQIPSELLTSINKHL